MTAVMAKEYFTQTKYTLIFIGNMCIVHYIVYEGLNRQYFAFGLVNLKKVIP